MGCPEWGLGLGSESRQRGEGVERGDVKITSGIMAG